MLRDSDGSWRAYFDAPVNANDEAPLTLWRAPAPEGPWRFSGVAADGDAGAWDWGRYSGGSVIRPDGAGLFHVFLSASATRANKVVENLGWATSSDGVSFVKNQHNPLASAALNATASEVLDGRRSRTTPGTTAMAEASVFVEVPFVYVHHTIRWLPPPSGGDPFAPHGRNAEDLGVEVFSPSPTFNLSFPVVSGVTLAPGGETVCSYDRQAQRYCPPLKAVITAAGDTTAAVLRPRMHFTLSARSGCGHGKLVVRVHSYTDEGGVGAVLNELPVNCTCGGGKVVGATGSYSAPPNSPRDVWVAATVALASGSASGLERLELGVRYESSPHAPAGKTDDSAASRTRPQRGLAVLLLAHATSAPSTSWSELKMETCDKDNTAQSFEIDSATGTGRIRDSETGRCVTMKTCTLGSGIQKSIEVGLQECGEDECDGKASEWVASAATAPGSTMFSSALKGSTGECYVLNVRNADTLPVVAYGDPTCSPSSTNNQWLDPKAGQMHTATGQGCAPNCCLTADPCVPPACVLPTGWAWPFVTTVLLAVGVYAVGGVGFGYRSMGKPLGPAAHPHHDQLAALGGLVADGFAFFHSQMVKGEGGGLSAPLAASGGGPGPLSGGEADSDDGIVE